MGDTDVEQQETSIEEILASIRRIIAEDEDETSVSFKEGKPSGAVDTDAEVADWDIDDDILELTNVIEGDDPEPADETEIVNEKLISNKVEEVSAASISALTAALAGNMALGNGNQTLEQLIKEVLRPILKEWLDDNLPDIVERIVREEVKRIAQRAN